MRIFILYISLFISVNAAFSQKATFSEHTIKNEKELAVKFNTLRQVTTNKELDEANDNFIAGLKVMLNEDEAFKYPFDSLKSMSKITSPDKEFRLFNWNVEMEDGSQKFYCLILKKDGEIIELNDKHRTTYGAEHKTMTEKNWYGAVYYEIIPLKRGQYTLLGWNGKDRVTTQKIVEVMTISRSKVKFGATIFKYENERDRKRRVILEFASDAYVSLKYYKTKKEEQIVFSHISPSTPQMEGHYQFYYPDLSYDKFVLEGNNWVYEPSADAKNEKETESKTDIFGNPIEYNSPNDPANPYSNSGRR